MSTFVRAARRAASPTPADSLVVVIGDSKTVARLEARLGIRSFIEAP